MRTIQERARAAAERIIYSLPADWTTRGISSIIAAEFEDASAPTWDLVERLAKAERERDEAKAEVERLTRTYNARERTVSQLRDICDDIRSSLERQETEEWPGRAEKKRRHDEEHKAIVREAVVRALREVGSALKDQISPEHKMYHRASEIEREGGEE